MSNKNCPNLSSTTALKRKNYNRLILIFFYIASNHWEQKLCAQKIEFKIYTEVIMNEKKVIPENMIVVC